MPSWEGKIHIRVALTDKFRFLYILFEQSMLIYFKTKIKTVLNSSNPALFRSQHLAVRSQTEVKVIGRKRIGPFLNLRDPHLKHKHALHFTLRVISQTDDPDDHGVSDEH